MDALFHVNSGLIVEEEVRGLPLDFPDHGA